MAMIGIMIGQWDQIFRRQLGGNDRTLLHECRDIRNRWAHQHAFTFPRRYKNTLAFLAPDAQRLEELIQATRQYLAWKSIEDEAETLNLDAFQKRQTETRCKATDDTVPTPARPCGDPPPRRAAPRPGGTRSR